MGGAAANLPLMALQRGEEEVHNQFAQGRHALTTLEQSPEVE